MPEHLLPKIPSDTHATPTAVRTLPPDLLRDASRRLSILAFVAGLLWIVGGILYHVSLRALTGIWHFPLGSDVFVALGAIFSLFLNALARRADREPKRILDFGLVHMVGTSFLIGMMLHWDPTEHVAIRPTVSWIGALVIIVSAMVPSTPGKTAVAGFVAVSMNPISMLIARARGTWNFASPLDAFLMHLPDFLLAGVAVVISHVMTGLGQQVAKAREMGSYRLGDVIGKGGMGEVHKATHRLLARPAAIKLIRSETLGPGNSDAARLAITRFRREAEAAARLQSPHTVALYDFGITDDQTFYFVMELLEGLDLETMVKRFGPLPPARVIHLLRQVCESLEEAHAAGLVHRDIKPANIHIGRLALAHDFVKVLDFGLVKSVGPALEDQETTLETAAGLAPGTPAYMAPEAALGQPVDGRADLYALGCVAYFLLTGRRVFEGSTGIQVMSRHLRDAPAPPSSVTEQAIPSALDRLVLDCLAKSPSDRPESARAIERALAAMDTGEWTEESARAWWAAHGFWRDVTASAVPPSARAGGSSSPRQ